MLLWCFTLQCSRRSRFVRPTQSSGVTSHYSVGSRARYPCPALQTPYPKQELIESAQNFRFALEDSLYIPTVGSAQIGEFQDLPLSLVVTPSPPLSYPCLPCFIGFSIVALRPNLSILGLPPGESQLSHIRPPFSLKDLLRSLFKSYFLYRLDEIFDILSWKSIYQIWYILGSIDYLCHPSFLADEHGCFRVNITY